MAERLKALACPPEADGPWAQRAMYYVYIIYSKKLNKKYIGFSRDIKNRIRYHNTGQSKFTARGLPWKLIYLEMFVSELDAREEEKFLKSGKGRDRIKFLLKETLAKT